MSFLETLEFVMTFSLSILAANFFSFGLDFLSNMGLGAPSKDFLFSELNQQEHEPKIALDAAVRPVSGGLIVLKNG